MRLIGPVATLTLVLASNASAQAGRAVAEKADRSGTPSPLRQFSRSIQALVTGVSPSVVQIIATGYGPHEGSRAAAELALGRQANADVKSALAGYVKIKYQAEQPDAPPAKDVMKRFDAVGLPTYVILRPITGR